MPFFLKKDVLGFSKVYIYITDLSITVSFDWVMGINLSKKNELFNLSWSRLIDEDKDILKIKKIFKN